MTWTNLHQHIVPLHKLYTAFILGYSQEFSLIFCHLLVLSRTFIQVRDPQWSASPASDAPPWDPSPLAGKTSQWLLPKLRSCTQHRQHSVLTGNCENLPNILFPSKERKLKFSNIKCWPDGLTSPQYPFWYLTSVYQTILCHNQNDS